MNGYTGAMQRPNVFDYLNFSEFIRDVYEYLKHEDSSFTHREFAARAGFKAASNLALVMDGTNRLTRDSIYKFSKGLGLTNKEAKYFENLVIWTQTEDANEREVYENKLRKHHTAFRNSRLNQDAYDLIANWYIVVLRELLEIEGQPTDPKELKKLLVPRVSWKKIDAALEILKRMNAVKEVDGQWETYNTVVETEDEIQDAAGRNYHREMIRIAREAVDRFGPSQRELGGVTSAIRADDMNELKAFMAKQRKEMLTFLTKLNQREGVNQVVQVNYQAFPVSEILAVQEQGNNDRD